MVTVTDADGASVGGMLLTRVGNEGSGINISGLYPDLYEDVTLTVRFRRGSENFESEFGALLAGPELTDFIIASVNDACYVIVRIQTSDGVGDLTASFDASAVFRPGDFNELQVRFLRSADGGDPPGGLIVSLNGTPVGEAPVPYLDGLVGVFFSSAASGDTVLIDRFTVEQSG